MLTGITSRQPDNATELQTTRSARICQRRRDITVLPQSGQADGHAKGDGSCPYAALGMAALTGADAVLLAIALGFILALGFLPVRASPRAGRLHLRPPLRGPPAHA